MRVLLILLALCSCVGQSYFEVQRAGVSRTQDVALCLADLHWDVEFSNNRRASTSWHRLRLRHSPLYVTEVQMRIVANLREESIRGLCTQRTIRADGFDEKWRFKPCTDRRALRMIDEAIRACGEEIR